MQRLPLAVAVVLAATLALLASGSMGPPAKVVVEEHEGRAPTAMELAPSVEAAFVRESYAPETRASLVIFERAPDVTMRIFRSGPEEVVTHGRNEMVGLPVSSPRRLGNLARETTIRVRIGDWPTGLYFARLESANGLVGFAPFVVRPRSLGENDVAVILPTRTWQAYNLRDDDGNGKGNSWYASWRIHSVRLGRPFLNRGVPYNFRLYDLPFLRWLSRNGKHVDVLADADLDAVASGRALANAYRLVIFPGHHEYVTTHEYDVVERYRDLGGDLIFLSANNFFWQVVKEGQVLRRTKLWRDLGRPESALIGVQYRGSNSGVGRRPWIVTGAPANKWLFAGTSVRKGSELSLGGIEIDKRTPASPDGIQVLAEIPDIFGPGFTGEMTYYETRRGAKVFAAGAFTLVPLPIPPQIARMLQNLWNHMAAGAAAE